MEQKTKRIILLTIKNTFKTLLGAAAISSFMGGCLYLSWKLTGDLYFGFAGLGLPFVLYTVWDYSKSQVEIQIESEQRLMNTLSKEYEPRI